MYLAERDTLLTRALLFISLSHDNTYIFYDPLYFAIIVIPMVKKQKCQWAYLMQPRSTLVFFFYQFLDLNAK